MQELGPDFAVIDIETTGLFPEKHDRIVEIAILRFDRRRTLLAEYSTLINPQRDMGPSHLHGITAREAAQAPTFDEVAGEIAARLSGAIIVGHNGAFDARFLQYEFERIGATLPEIALLCTLRMAYLAAPDLPGRKLESCCAHFGVDLPGAHSAYHDAAATSQLLWKCTDAAIGLELPVITIIGAAIGWPVLPRSDRCCTRSGARDAISDGPNYIARLVSRLACSTTDHAGVVEYLALVDRALEDRRLTEMEGEDLLRHAQELGISQERAIAAHHHYFCDLVRTALADGVLSESEREDLDAIRRLLAISEAQFAEYVTAAMGNREGVPAHHGGDLSGKSVCFTGAFRCTVNGAVPSRENVQRIARERGLVVRDGATKDLDILVAADPDSMSGKAAKARRYGTRIMSEGAFWSALGVQTE